MSYPFPQIKKLANVALNVAGEPQPVIDLALALERYYERTSDPESQDHARELKRMVAHYKRSIAPPPLENRDAGTPETKAKLRKDPVQAMLSLGTLTANEGQAIDALRNSVEAIAKGLGVKVSNLDGIRVDGRGAYVEPAERLSSELNRLYSTVYVPWANEMKDYVVPESTARKELWPSIRIQKQWVKAKRLTEDERLLIELTGGTMDAPLQCKSEWQSRVVRYVKTYPPIPISRYNLVLRVVMFGDGIRQIEREYKCRNSTLTPVFVGAVRRFLKRCDEAGIRF